MKLKTLKDIDEELAPFEVTRKSLKAEAVKWVKTIDKRMAKCDCKLGDCRSCTHDLILRKWIKHFFNITEEDLKW